MDRVPAYWDVVIAYMEQAHAVLVAREDWAEAGAVTERLGFSDEDENDWMSELTKLGVIRRADVFGGSTLFRLLPKGLAFMEGRPSLEAVLAASESSIDSAAAPLAADKESAKQMLRRKLLEKAMSMGIDAGVQAIPTIWSLLRMQFPWLPGRASAGSLEV